MAKTQNDTPIRQRHVFLWNCHFLNVKEFFVYSTQLSGSHDIQSLVYIPKTNFKDGGAHEAIFGQMKSMVIGRGKVSSTKQSFGGIFKQPLNYVDMYFFVNRSYIFLHQVPVISEIYLVFLVSGNILYSMEYSS